MSNIPNAVYLGSCSENRINLYQFDRCSAWAGSLRPKIVNACV